MIKAALAVTMSPVLSQARAPHQYSGLLKCQGGPVGRLAGSSDRRTKSAPPAGIAPAVFLHALDGDVWVGSGSQLHEDRCEGRSKASR